MQAVAENQTQENITVSLETIGIVILVTVSLLIHLSALGSVPLTPAEAPQTLATWRAITPQAPGADITPDSAMVFWSQRLGFAIFGGSEFGARIFTALAGVLLSLSPLLFRDLLGKTRAYMLTILLVFSPVLMAAARLSAGSTWTLLFAVIGLWAVWRYWQGNAAYSFVATTAFLAMILLTDPGGMMLGVILAVAGGVSVFLTALDSPDDIPEWRERFQDWPWVSSLFFAGLVIVGLSTGFLLYPSGLSLVSGALDGFVTGFFTSRDGSPLIVSLFYELWLWFFAIAALIYIARQNTLAFVERFFAVWILVAGIASLIFQGAEAHHALWLIVPLAGLSSYIFADSLAESDEPVMWFDTVVEDEDRLRWVRWGASFIMFALLVMTAVHFQIASRGFLIVPGGDLNQYIDRIGEVGFNNVASSMIWLFISVLFIIVGYFLAASVWGNLAAYRIGVLGAFGFVLMTGFANGWYLTVEHADDPIELWHSQTASHDASLLRETLLDFSLRETSGFPQVPVAIVAEDDGILGWLLRDFEQAIFVDNVSQARGYELIIVPQTVEPPDLGGSYLGQPFAILQDWDENTMEGFDFLAWWSVKEARFDVVTTQQVVLWVRQDIFDSNPFVGG